MINLSERQNIVLLIDSARAAGCRLKPACELLRLDVRTYQRWTRNGSVELDRRPLATRPIPQNRISEAEREKILHTCHKPEFASLPPSQIVPRLADLGTYLASESSIYRILRKEKEQNHRGRAKQPKVVKPPSSHCATGPNQVWSWDITWLPGFVFGHFFFLYLFIDIYSRKIVGWEVYDRESAENAAPLVRTIVLKEGCINTPLVLHSDNGSPQKGQTMTAMLDSLNVSTSYSRPRVSDDNPFSEAIFRTLKYRPAYPSKGFNTIEDARNWIMDFVDWYNNEHCHSGIKFVSPEMRHSGEETEVLAKRAEIYEQAKKRHPERWSGETRNWSPVGDVWLNPTKDLDKRLDEAV